jgi:hypothetical protein
MTRVPAEVRVEKEISMKCTKGLVDLLPPALQGLTTLPWVEPRPSEFFLQVEGLRVRVSPCLSGFKVQFDQYQNKKLIPGPSRDLSSLAAAIQFAEEALAFAAEEWLLNLIRGDDGSVIRGNDWIRIRPRLIACEPVERLRKEMAPH